MSYYAMLSVDNYDLGKAFSVLGLNNDIKILEIIYGK
jgi:hypothetical protein